MVLRDLIRDVFETLWAHKLRTALTMFGIAWGVISIVLMVAAGEGLRVGQAKVSANFGKDLMIIFAGRTSLQAGGTRAGRRIEFVDTDIPVLQSDSPDCEWVIPELETSRAKIHSNYNASAQTVTGSYPAFADIRTINVADGRFYNWNDLAETRRVAFLGTEVKKQLFGGRNPIGENIYLDDIPYEVIGTMKTKDQDSSYDGFDINKVYVPYTAMHMDFPNKPPATPHGLDQLLVTPKSVAQHEACKGQVIGSLARLHSFDPHDKEAASVWDTIEEAQAFKSHDRRHEVLPGRCRLDHAVPRRTGRDERDAGRGARAHARDRGAQGRGRAVAQHHDAVLCRDHHRGLRQRRAWAWRSPSDSARSFDLLPMPQYFAGLLPTWQSGLLSVGSAGTGGDTGGDVSGAARGID